VVLADLCSALNEALGCGSQDCATLESINTALAGLRAEVLSIKDSLNAQANLFEKASRIVETVAKVVSFFVIFKELEVPLKLLSTILQGLQALQEGNADSVGQLEIGMDAMQDELTKALARC